MFELKSLPIEKYKACGLHSAVRFIFLVCRILGLLPLSGLMYLNRSQLRFKLFHPYNIICIICVMGQLVLSGSSLVYFCMNTSFRNIHKFVINANGLTLTLLVMWLGIKWPPLINKASVIERSLPQPGKRDVTKICILVNIAILCGFVVDRILSITFYAKLSETCAVNETLIQAYYEYTLFYIYRMMPFTYWNAFFLEVFQEQLLLMTTVADIIIVDISLYLTSLFENLNEMIVLYKEKPGMWSILRSHYTRLSRLVRLMNSHITVLVLVSFGSNLILVCVHLYKILRKEIVHATDDCDQDKVHKLVNGIERKLYFFFSFFFMAGRGLFTQLMAARLHTTSKESLTSIHGVDTTNFTLECQRLLEQINTSNVVITGMDFFEVNKKMILSDCYTPSIKRWTWSLIFY